MNKIYKSITCLTFMILIVSAKTVEASIYKCVSNSGKTYYADKPCPIDNEETELKPVKDPLNGYIAPEFVPDKIDANNKGTIVGTNSSLEIDNKDQNTSEDHSLEQSQGQISNIETANASDLSEDVGKLTDSDKAFNAKLKQNPITIKGKEKISPSKRNLLELEPPGESS